VRYSGAELDQLAEVERRLQRGMAAWGAPEPMTLDQWARKHFYLSAESSYVEQQWTPWPFQRAIMSCISNDDVAAVYLKKSARVGYTKIILASVGYFAEHKRRNQGLWQPTDEDRDEFVKSELDPMLRDVASMRNVLPSYLSRHKDNTLQQKKFIGSMLHLKGAKAAKNFRRISIDVAYLDEADACDRDVEKEGDPPTLILKRLEGATFPKFVAGTTPKLRGFSLIDDLCTAADARFTYQIPCPHCGERHPITWGGKDEPHGFKWTSGDPATVRHLCPHCSALIGQAEYLAVAEQGVWVSECGGIWLHHDGRFTSPVGTPLPAIRRVAFHVWTAYSPVVTWASIVSDFIAAHTEYLSGKPEKLKAWTNTTKGESWEGEIERTDADELKNRAEPFPLRQVPRGCMLLLCGADTQDNRVEFHVWGLGTGGEMWTIDHKVIFGNPATTEFWEICEAWIRAAEYQHACGLPIRLHATAIDSGGHHADAVYAFAHRLRALKVHAIRGTPGRERSIENGNTKVGFRWNGKVERQGPVLWHVGTNLAKDRLKARIDIATPGPGYIHFSDQLSDEWFKQLAGEVRATRQLAHGSESRWTPTRKRNEAIDCAAYAIWLEERLGLWAPSKAKFWDALRLEFDPPEDLFSLAAQAPSVRPLPALQRPVQAAAESPAPQPIKPVAIQKTQPEENLFEPISFA
jgi:phage terminase large subunit GpA-like protein